MKLLHATILVVLGIVANLQADDFTRRYGVNSQIYDAPLYFSRNQHIACKGQERVRHAKRVVYENNEEDTTSYTTHDLSEERTSIEALDNNIQIRSQALVAEKSAQMHQKQEALEQERKQLENELASLRMVP